MNKIYIDSKAFSLDLSDGLDVKGNAISNLADPISQTDSSNKRYIDTKTNNFLKNRWVRNGVWQSQYEYKKYHKLQRTSTISKHLRW